MPQFTLADIGAILQVSPSPSTNLTQTAAGLSTDTRTLNRNEIFVALRGEQFDGHNFIETALERGAIAFIVERLGTVPAPQFQVEDTLAAYQKIARWWRDRREIPVIAVTGSVGKTTTKELIAAVLSLDGQVLKTEANYNNEIGVPKTLLELEPQHDYAVIEMAMRARGEIALLTQIARPTIGVITNVGTAHIGRLGSRAAIAAAKCELLARMSPSGVAILNAEDRRLIDTAAAVWQGRTITYGLEHGEVRGELIAADTLRVGDLKLPLPLPGRHNALNTLAAVAVASALGFDLTALQNGLTVNLPKGRARRYQLPNDILILDETYNAGLESMLAALHLLKETPGTRRIAVLGTMKELGDYAVPLHQQVGATVGQLGIEQLLVLIDEPATEAIAQGAAGVATQCFTTHDELTYYLSSLVQAGDRILFKASNSVGLSRVVEKFRAQF
ncbi:MAG: UDP-N-acetylmuramoyl-tripeptide--D-alanyl-D-alanine ligase [Cyanophyceae cyanobacterium]